MRERAKSAGVIHWAESDWVQRRTSFETVFRYLDTAKIRLWIVILSEFDTSLGPNYQSDLVKWNEASPLTVCALKMRFHVCDPEKSSQNLRLRWPGLSPIPRLGRGERRGRRMRRATPSLIWRLARTNRWECCRQSWRRDDELHTMDVDQELETKKDWNALSLHQCM